MPANSQAPNPQAGDSPAAAVRVVNLRRILWLALGLYLLIAFFHAIVTALLLFFIAFLFAVVLNVPVRWLEHKGVPRGLSASGVALLILGGLAAAAYAAGPPLADQATTLIQTAPERVQRIAGHLQDALRHYPALEKATASDALQTGTLVHRAISYLPRLGRYTLGLLGVLLAGLFALVAALYLVASPRTLVRGLLDAVPAGARPRTARALARIVAQLQSWALATLILMAIVGTACGLGLWAIGVSNPLLFGLLAGFGEAIPTIGPILSALPPMAVALADEPIKAVWVAVLFLAVQQLENNLLVPLIMGRTVKLHPVSILFFVLALGSLVGILGALLAVPTAIIVKVLWEEFYLKRQAPESDTLDDEVQRVLDGDAGSCENEGA